MWCTILYTPLIGLNRAFFIEVIECHYATLNSYILYYIILCRDDDAYIIFIFIYSFEILKFFKPLKMHFFLIWYKLWLKLSILFRPPLLTRVRGIYCIFSFYMHLLNVVLGIVGMCNWFNCTHARTHTDYDLIIYICHHIFLIRELNSTNLKALMKRFDDIMWVIRYRKYR